MQEFKSEKGILGFQQSGFPDGLEGDVQERGLHTKVGPKQKERYCHLQRQGRLRSSQPDRPIFA